MPPESNPSAPGAVMQIGEVATRTELSLRSLRHWEEVGLLRPSGRSEGGFRLYTAEDVEKILVIRRMKPLGFTLDQMKAVMADIETIRDPAADAMASRLAVDRLAAIRADVDERRAKLARHLEMADEFIALLAQEVP
ncbi:MerR family transcriptional regulator [Nocardioides sp. Y6]|uniref:MerR family transcriptional regulator n=1 Tax=Nocardioides malaquae TaxID=2773426 RepID=A0ABR9RVZ3_9ACTN|nr:MerR family transcriptional regulator [Nocardioides malaquae]MBE7325762.1 MerR family transcriptional regulator [Nocardioides malaquae]